MQYKDYLAENSTALSQQILKSIQDSTQVSTQAKNVDQECKLKSTAKKLGTYISENVREINTSFDNCELFAI